LADAGKMPPTLPLGLALAFLAAPALLNASGLPSAVQARVDEQIKLATAWAAEPAVVQAVREHNRAVPPAHAQLDQLQWKALSARDPLVTEFTRNAAGQFLSAKRNALVVEAFLSDANGLKVAFIAKPTNWSHAGKPKHDLPMSGQTWQGPIEVDESTGYKALQLSVPVLDENKPIGSLVVGLNVAELIH
jgi:hypothetical protein